MGKLHGSFRRTLTVGVLLAGLVLALSVAGIAFAANTASFAVRTPSGATTNNQPMVSVSVYDTYGVRGSSSYWMKIDGTRVTPTITYHSGWGYRWFTLSRQVSSPLSLGTHNVVVQVYDLGHHTSSTSWNFTVIPPPDVTAPSTTSDVLFPPTYVSPAIIHLSATDNPGGSGVAHTYYILDGGVQHEGTAVTVPAAGPHNLTFWSVDAAGNVETPHTVSFSVTNLDLTPPVTTSDATSTYRGSAIIQLSATDAGGSGVAHTYYTLDDGVRAETPWVMTGVLGLHSQKFWSEDVAGNGEATHPVGFTVIDVHTMPSVVGCTDGSCHDATSLVSLHNNDCALCHTTSGTPPSTCTAVGCHGIANPHPSADASHTATGDCVSAGCHSTDVRVEHNGQAGKSGPGTPPGCGACHAVGVTPSLICADCHHGVHAAHVSGGEGVRHTAITTTTVGGSSDTTNTGCVTCHGVNGSADLATVHAALGCSCHSNPAFATIIANGIAGTPIKCTDCHADWDSGGAHGDHTLDHPAIAPASGDTTNTACVSSGCHDTNLVTAHLNPSGTSCSSTCHARNHSMPDSCMCHELAPTGLTTAVAAKGGTLAGNIAAGAAGTPLVCTDCHNTPNHMGHTPADYYSVPLSANATSKAGEPPYHSAITSVTVSHEATNTLCINCHGINGSADLAMVHRKLDGCFCHTQSQYATLIANGISGTAIRCTDCHDGSMATIHPTETTSHAVSGTCYSSGCHHWTDVSDIHTKGDDPPGCAACHGAGKTPSLDCFSCHTTSAFLGYHSFTHVDASGTKSSACTSCHGTDLPTAHNGVFTGQANLGCFCHTSSMGFSMAGEMAPLLLAGHAECVDCHKGPYAAHGFTGTEVDGVNAAASGHNTTTYGTVGAHEKWDGSEGVVVKDSANTTITQEWPLPTTSVFWSQSKALNADGSVNNAGVYSLNPTDSPAVALAAKGLTPAAIDNTVGWGSVITCNDCHSGLVAGGPNGSAQINAGIDPNFPDDWTKAEITSWDPTGMRSIATTMGTSNPYYKQINTSISGGTFPTVSSPDPAVATIVATAPVGAFMVPVTRGELISSIGPSSPASQTTFYAVYDGSAQADSRAVMSTAYSRGATPSSRFICQKCHKLTNSYQGIIIEGNGRGGRDNNLNYMGMSNEAHMEHHNDLINGQGNCVSCHVAIPHGWKRPRLLVYESDPAPYKTQWTFTGSDAKPFYQSVVCTSPAQDTSNGNWGYFGPTQPSYLGATISASSRNGSQYKQIGNAIPNGSTGTTPTSGDMKGIWYSPNGLDTVQATVNNSGKTYSSHLEGLSASQDALKELENGPDLTAWASNDTTNSTSWGKWYTGTGGVGWVADANPNALYSDEAAQNNCNACTSAGLTHSDTGGTGEGIAGTVVTGRQAWGGSFTTSGTTTWQTAGGGGPWTAVPYWK